MGWREDMNYLKHTTPTVSTGVNRQMLPRHNSSGAGSSGTGNSGAGNADQQWGGIKIYDKPTAFTGGPSAGAMDQAGALPAGMSFNTAADATAGLGAYYRNKNGGSPTNPAGSPTSPGGGYGSYSGGGGLTDAGMKQIMQLLGRKPKQYEYNPLAIDDYQGTGFRDWDGSMYDMARSGITEGLAADAAAGAAAYGDARTELDQYRNPFAGREYATNQGMPDAMQRMLAANNATLDPTETARGSEADAAFGNVLALLGGTADQAQASAQRALGGDERRFNESLASQGRTMNLGVNMTEAKARQQYEQDKWQYGEDIARANYEKNSQVAMANNQGQNQTDQANVGLANDAQSSGVDTLIQLLASGQKIDPAQLAAFMGG